MKNSNADRPYRRNDTENIAMEAVSGVDRDEESDLDRLARLAKAVSGLETGADRLRDEANKLDEEARRARGEIVETVLSIHRSKGGRS